MNLTYIKPSNSLNGLLKLKSQLSNSISLQTRNLELLVEAMDGTIDPLEVDSISFESTLSETNALVQMYGSQESGVSYLNTIVTDIETGHNEQRSFNLGIITSLDQIKLTDELYLEDVMSQLNDNQKINELIGEINDLFLCSNKVNLSTISALSEPYLDQIPGDTKMIRSQLAAISQENYITKSAFLSWVQSICKFGKNIGDSRNFDVDDSNPYKIRKFSNVLQDVLQQSPVLMFAAISTVFGSLLGALGVVISTVMNLWKQLSTSVGTVTIDEDQPILHVAGPIAVIPGQQMDRPIGQPGSILDTDLIVRLQRPGFEMFWWKQSNKYMGNVFLTLNVHPDRFMRYVNACTMTPATSENFHLDPDSHFLFPEEDDPEFEHFDLYEEMFLTEQEEDLLKIDESFLLRTCWANICAVAMHCCRNGGNYYCNNILSDFPWNPNTPNGYYDKLYWTSVMQICMAEIVRAKLNNTATTKTWFTESRFSSSNLATVWNYIFEMNHSLVNNQFVALFRDGIVTINNTSYPISGTVFDSPYCRLMTTMSGGTPLGYYKPVYTLDESDLLDYYPVSPKIIMPSFNTEKFLQSLILLGVIVSASLIAFKTIKRAIHYKSLVHKQRAVKNLNDKYATAIATGANNDIKAFAKADRRFRLKARIFGWGSYDVTNQWWDSAGYGNSSTGVLSSVTSRVVSASTDAVSAGIINSISTVNDNTNTKVSTLEGALTQSTRDINLHTDTEMLKVHTLITGN